MHVHISQGARVAQWVRSLDLTTHASISPIRRGFAPCFVNYKKGALNSQPQVIVYQLLAHGRWFSPGTLASSTTKTDRHDIAEIFLKVALKHQQSINQSIVMLLSVCPSFCQSFCNIFVNTLEAHLLFCFDQTWSTLCTYIWNPTDFQVQMSKV